MMSRSITFDQQLSIVELAVTKTFNNKHIGQYVKQVFDEINFLQLKNVLDDLNNIKDSFIMHSVTEKVNQNNNYNWNTENDEQKLHTLLLRIFKDKIIDIDKLIVNQNSKPQPHDHSQPLLPNTLKECNKYQIFDIVSNICNDINKSESNSINIENIEKLIISENLNGSIITNLSAKDFTIKATHIISKHPKLAKYTFVNSYYDNQVKPNNKRLQTQS